MSEWKGYRLGEIATPVRDKIETSCLSSSSYISTENMLPNKAGVTLSSGIPSGNAVKFKKEDILISNIRPYFKKNWRADKIGECSADVMCLRALECVDPTFLYYLLSQDMFFNYVMQGSKGTKMPRGDRNQIMQWPVKIPCFDTQRYIASFLSSLDDKIAVNKKICENLEAQAQALFKHWFVDFAPFKDGNFCANREQNETCFNSAEVQPKITGKACKFVESELGLIPEGWRVGTLGDIAEFKRGKTITKSDITDGSVPVVAGGLEPAYYHNKSNTSSRVITISGSGANAGFTRMYYQPVWASDCSFVENISTPFLHTAYCYLLTNKKKVDALQWGAAQPHVYAKDINKLPLAIAPLDILNHFEELVSEMFDLIEINDKEIFRLSTLRDTLLPKLMSGEIKV